MSRDGSTCSSTAIELRICEIVDREQTLTFTTLATTLHDCQWITLLRALNHLEKRHMIRLTPLPWDYQICGTASMATGTD